MTTYPTGTFTFEAHDKLCSSNTICLHDILLGVLLYTAPIILPPGPSPQIDQAPPTISHASDVLLQEILKYIDWDSDTPKLTIQKLNVNAKCLL